MNQRSKYIQPAAFVDKYSRTFPSFVHRSGYYYRHLTRRTFIWAFCLLATHRVHMAFGPKQHPLYLYGYVLRSNILGLVACQCVKISTACSRGFVEQNILSWGLPYANKRRGHTYVFVGPDIVVWGDTGPLSPSQISIYFQWRAGGLNVHGFTKWRPGDACLALSHPLFARKTRLYLRNRICTPSTTCNKA